MESELVHGQPAVLLVPELGPIAGYAVTCTYGLPDPTFKALSLMDVLEAMDALGKPSILL